MSMRERPDDADRYGVWYCWIDHERDHIGVQHVDKGAKLLPPEHAVKMANSLSHTAEGGDELFPTALRAKAMQLLGDEETEDGPTPDAADSSGEVV